MRKIIIILSIILLSACIKPSPEIKDKSIESGLKFIELSQEDNGVFLVERTENNETSLEETPYITTYIIDLSNQNNEVSDKAISYLINTSDNGYWKFYPHKDLPPYDTDDTSMSSLVLLKKGNQIPEHVINQLIKQQVRGDSVFGSVTTQDLGFV